MCMYVLFSLGYNIFKTKKKKKGTSQSVLKVKLHSYVFIMHWLVEDKKSQNISFPCDVIISHLISMWPGSLRSTIALQTFIRITFLLF